LTQASSDTSDVLPNIKHVMVTSMLIYFCYLFPEFRMQQYKQNSRVHNTIYAYMDTEGRMCRHLHSANKTKNASN